MPKGYAQAGIRTRVAASTGPHDRPDYTTWAPTYVIFQQVQTPGFEPGTCRVLHHAKVVAGPFHTSSLKNQSKRLYSRPLYRWAMFGIWPTCCSNIEFQTLYKAFWELISFLEKRKFLEEELEQADLMNLKALKPLQLLLSKQIYELVH